MQNWHLISIGLIFFCSCSSEDKPSQAHASNSVSFTVKGAKDEDLLNMHNDPHIDSDNIHLYSFVNGQPEELLDGNLDYPKHFRIEKNLDGIHQIDLFPYVNYNDNPSLTLINWGNGDTDTLKIDNSLSDQSVSNQKIWLNGIVLWEKGDNSKKLFELIK